MVLQRLLADGKVGIAGGTLGGSGESEPRTPGPCPLDSSGRAGVDERRWLPGGGLWSQCRASFIPPLGPQCRGGCRRVGSVLPPGSWTRRPVLFPGSDFNTETWRPSPFICKDGPSFPSHCSPGPWGAAGVLCAGQGASGTPGRAPVTIAINRHSVTPRAGIAVAVGCVYS